MDAYLGASKMKQFAMSFLLVVINPYKNLNYSKINVYNLKRRDHRIVVTESEKEKSKKVSFEMQFCFICNPPQYVPVEVWE